MGDGTRRRRNPVVSFLRGRSLNALSRTGGIEGSKGRHLARACPRAS